MRAPARPPVTPTHQLHSPEQIKQTQNLSAAHAFIVSAAFSTLVKRFSTHAWQKL